MAKEYTNNHSPLSPLSAALSFSILRPLVRQIQIAPILVELFTSEGCFELARPPRGTGEAGDDTADRQGGDHRLATMWTTGIIWLA